MKDFLIKGRRLDGEMDRRAIYVLKITNSYDFTSIAMDVHMHQGHIRYYDTNRGHEIEGEIIFEDEKGFKFLSEGFDPGVWEFKILTIEYFKEQFYKNVVIGSIIAEKIHTTDDLHFWYRREFGV